MGTNTGIGIGIGIPFKNNALGGDRPYLPPELKARLIGVWDNYGKKNTDTDRNIIKNKIPNAGGDLEILNSAYRLNSGFGGYSNDFQEYTYSENVVVKDNTNAIFNSGGKLLVPYSYLTKDIPSFKIKVSGLSNTYHFRYYYRDSNGVQHSVNMAKDGNYELPICYNVQSSSDGTNCGFANYGSDIVSVEILPEYEGAFVTDGVNDMIISQKTLQEMGVTKDFTIVSMIHQITLRGATAAALTNYIRQPIGYEYVRNHVANIGKTGIYGYVVYDVNHSSAGNSHIINTILGDKNDYSIHITGNLSQGKFSVQGYINGEDNIVETSRLAHYWTFALLGKATEDDINLIIGYFNLDRTLKADIYCNIERQGITNDNHAEFNDKLIDYSGNGRDLQLFNIGWKGNSGIGNYPVVFGANETWKEKAGSGNDHIFTFNANKYHIKQVRTSVALNFSWIKKNGKLTDYNKDIPAFKLKIIGLDSRISIKYNYIPKVDATSSVYINMTSDGIYELPKSFASDGSISIDSWIGFSFSKKSSDVPDIVTDLDIIIEIIPSNAKALCLDGINDFGKVINMPIYKDYTIIADYIRTQININAEANSDSCVLSKAELQSVGAFMFNLISGNREDVSYSFGHRNIVNINDTIRAIYYQSKYINNGQDIDIESTFIDSNKLWLGTFRDNDSRFLNGAIYFLMSFPYSMNKFLIERQLKKYKAGTLYKDMVEFRPVINSNIDIKEINYWDKDSNVIKVGDYVSIGSNIKTSITVLDGYKISKVSSTAFNNITIEKSNTDFIYDVIFYGIKKSPQKINLVIEQDSDYVQWNPNIKANVSKYSVTANIRKTDGTTLKLVNGQFYSTSITGNLVLDIVSPYKDSDEVTNVVIDGKSYTPTKDSSGNYYRLEIPLVFPKEINITIQEYIRYEDIVQPYPVLLRFKDENNNEISWGDKIKLGSSITRIGLFNDCNLLKDIYTVSNAKLNGNPLTSTPHVVERQMVFTCTATWIFDDNEPNCILSPRLLRVPNSSYKILGHIPDISGHGNHGKINNSAYAGMSGVNDYPYDYKSGFMAYSNSKLIDSETFNIIAISASVNIIKSSPTYKGKIKVTGLSGYLKLRIYPKNDSTNAVEIFEDGIYDINIDNETDNIYFHAVKTNVGSNDVNIIIQQVGEYEGAFYLDGVEDFITIPTLSKGGKQVLMKVNWSTLNGFIYDQRPASGDKTFGIYTQGDVIAYSQHNNGNTYIDGIINNNIIGNNLSKITHNIVATCDVDNSITPSIGKRSYSNSYFAQMSLYDFMLFDEISTETKIKELNTYIGITPKVTLPNYYWDNYGKKNTDANRGYIDEQVSLQKTGTSVNPLENFNISYEGMSGYNGYPVVLGANKTWETSNAVDYIYDINSTIVHITNVKHAANGLLYSYVKKDGALANIKEIPAFRVTVKGLEGNSKLVYKYLATENATKESIVYLGNGIHKLPKSFVPTDALLDLTTNSWIGFAITPMIEGELVFDCDITIEILPEYENGLAYDGVSDFTDNKNIPIFTDFTAIIKRVDLDAKNDNSTVMFKGNKIYESSIGNGFILDYCYNSKNYVYSYGKLNQIKRDDSKIIYLTPESYNGNPIIKGENEDNLGLVFGKYWKGIIYKTILYSKTISLLEINFLKNLMEKDEIIDINHPIFISNTEDESNASQDT